ncbi:stress response protein SCP2 [Nocardioides zeae]|uniref:Stress response protein SCP2 n=1 Tax=Nocardioides zeae TaxID=1457234 RepID=A0ACC6IFL9_9ACTN|nr:TerD family protein [Nocardioides zeae]MDR6176543.1 stress response protein SCP2 [Nocardioides zeae]MDR6209555.1 stress response protein SCP2 [Nocardioides zeae]
MTDVTSAPRELRKGANVAIRDLGGELGGLTVFLDSRGHDGETIDADVSVLLLDASGKVRSSADFVFYNQPIALNGAVHLRDKLVPEPDSDEAAAGWSSDVVTLELDDVPQEIERIVVAASLDASTGRTFGDAAAVRLRLQRSSDAADLLVFVIEDVTTESALVFGEFYRRDEDWKIRAVGRGYQEGLAALVTEHGIDVSEEAEEPEESDSPAVTEEAGVEPAPAEDVIAPPAPPMPEVLEEDPGAATPATPAKRSVSVRRPTRAPRLPADWNASIPADDGNDWQAARLFPVAGIGSGEEQERRATSALLAVMSMVREFGAALTGRCGAPRGTITTYIEVPFGQDEEAYRPDGVIQVRRGTREWTALVEVKTSTGRLNVEQIEKYVEIARARGYDAVITISNELAGGDADHPVAVDRRKLRKVSLHHLSWDQIRAEAVLAARHRGVADATQGKVLEEFIRYMSHARSGMGGLGDMGPSWVKLRDAVKSKTARASDKATGEVSARFDELIQHLGHHMTGLLGVEVQSLAPREAPDHASRRQQLADSGLMFGRLKVPGAVDVLVVGADLRADKASAAITIGAPRGDTRPLTRVNWLLRQLPDEAKDSIRIEAHMAGPRAVSTAALLGKARQDPSCLVPEEQREIKAFTISLEVPLGSKRAAGTGTLIGSVKGATTTFYADVVQHLRPWVAKVDG